ncbi:MAG: hypothetical protein AAF696_32010, partial [Bacteroidota bacterium]
KFQGAYVCFYRCAERLKTCELHFKNFRKGGVHYSEMLDALRKLFGGEEHFRVMDSAFSKILEMEFTSLEALSAPIKAHIGSLKLDKSKREKHLNSLKTYLAALSQPAISLNLKIYELSYERFLGLQEKYESHKDQPYFKALESRLNKIQGAEFFNEFDFIQAIQPKGRNVLLPPYPEFRSYVDALLSDANPNYMGRKSIPIPLRYYPQAPSLILQEAEADESSRTVIRDLREWRYTLIYEHLEVAQDSIECIVRLNVADEDNINKPQSQKKKNKDLPRLVNLLYSFQEKKTEFEPAIQALKSGGDPEKAKVALKTFHWYCKEIAEAWESLKVDNQHHYLPKEGDLHLEVSEETLSYVGDTSEAQERQAILSVHQGLKESQLIKLSDTQVRARRKKLAQEEGLEGDAALASEGIIKVGDTYYKQVLPLIALPGFRLEQDYPKDHPAEPSKDLVARREFRFLIDPEDQSFFGDSSIPDRKLSIDNLDLFQQQNAWASIWLSRNKDLILGKKTHEAFIFRTPAVRFTNRTIPSIVNDEPWNVAKLPDGTDVQKRELSKHLENMLDLFEAGVKRLDPRGKNERYELRISCRYAYTLVEGSGLNEDITTTLPLLLGLRIKPAALKTYHSKLAKEIHGWFKKIDPVRRKAFLVFAMEAYSQLDPDEQSSLPLLQVRQLNLELDDITDL